MLSFKDVDEAVVRSMTDQGPYDEVTPAVVQSVVEDVAAEIEPILRAYVLAKFELIRSGYYDQPKN